MLKFDGGRYIKDKHNDILLHNKKTVKIAFEWVGTYLNL